MPKRKPVVDSAELADVVCKAVATADAPVTVPQLRKMVSGPYRVVPSRLLEVLRELVAAGRLYEFPPVRTQPLFWDRSHDDYARKLIADTVAAAPSSLADICKRVFGKLKDFGTERFAALLREMRDANRIIEHPPLPGARTSRYGNRPPEPRPYLKKVVEQLEKVQSILAGAGVTKEEVVSALVDLLGAAEAPAEEAATRSGPESAAVGAIPSADETPVVADLAAREVPEPATDWDAIGERLIAEMHRLEPGAAQGALVSIRDLRRSLPDLDKSTFDRVVLRLADRGRVTLHRHDYPAGELPEVRELLVRDDRGDYYIGVALRR